MRSRCCIALCLLTALHSAVHADRPGTPVTTDERKGQEIVVAGQLFAANTSVVLWTDAGGYDQSRFTRPTRRTVAVPATQPGGASTYEERVVRGGETTLDEVQQSVDQFVIHFDACGFSKECDRVLRRRGLAVQFMCDLDGTIYQTMDVRNSAAHATIANTRSIGVEVAHIGGAPAEGPMPGQFTKWYEVVNGQARLRIPPEFGDAGIRTPNFVGRPARPQLIIGNVQGRLQRQYDFTPQQYQALANLAATLCTVFPKIQPDYPRQRVAAGPPTTGPTTQPIEGDPTTQPAALAEPEERGVLIPHALTRAQFDAFQGILGHYHVQTNKDDPGVAFQWNPFIERVRFLMSTEAKAKNKRFRHQPAIYPSTQPASQPVTQPSTEPTGELLQGS